MHVRVNRVNTNFQISWNRYSITNKIINTIKTKMFHTIHDKIINKSKEMIITYTNHKNKYQQEIIDN